MIWYMYGKIIPLSQAVRLGPDFGEKVMAHLETQIPKGNLIPTNYEAADKYLREELKKPKGSRDLLREMCVVIPMSLPKDRKVWHKSNVMKTLIELSQGESLAITTFCDQLLS